jgi:ADP-heptose:LPS heptosyltransferase
LISALIKRIRLAYEWRQKQLRLFFLGFLARGGGRRFIQLRWPWPLKKPYQRRNLRLSAPGGGIGDELMCTPIFREIKRLNPQCHITFVSRQPELFRKNPNLDAIETYVRDSKPKGIVLNYAHVMPPSRPLITLMAECVGLILRATELDTPEVTPSPSVQKRLASIPSPRIVIQPLASRWTPNKNWPANYWIELVRMLTAHFEVIEVGTESLLPKNELGPRFHSFAGTTDINDFIWLISQATVFVGPISGGTHLANAFKVPSVIIYGGYESPEGFEYPRLIPFYSAVECAPCWLNTPCPYELKCLKMIQPKTVAEAVFRLAEGIEANPTLKNSPE